MNKLSIRNRILLASLLPSVVLALMLATLFLRDRLTVLNEAYQQRAEAMARQVAAGSEFGLFSGNRGALQTLIDHVAKEDDVRSISIFDPSGVTVAQTGRPIVKFIPSKVASDNPDIEVRGSVMVVRHVVAGDELAIDELLWQATPTKKKVLGYLAMELSMDSIAKEARHLQIVWATITLAILIFGGSLAALLSRGVVRKIDQVTDVVARIGNGDVDARVVSDSNGPLRALEEGVNGMAQQIAAGRNELEQRVAEATSSLRRHQEHLTELVRQRTQQVVAMSIEIAKTEERERRAIALELHDGLGQLLAVARLKLSVLDISPDKLASVQSELQFIDGLIGQANESVRSLSLQLGPSLPQTKNLAFGLRWLADNIHNTFGVRVNLHIEELPIDLDPAMLPILLRVTRELLANVARHSMTRNADLTTALSGGRLILSVSDAGIGFDVAHASRPSAKGRFGLLSVREQIDYLGGEFSVDSSPGNGTVAIVSLPVAFNWERKDVS